MKRIKTTFIATIFNESTNIELFLDSIFHQSEMPDEVILIDGGSRDGTPQIVRDWIKRNKIKINLKLFAKRGNRSVGRNEAIKKSSNNLILCSDSGNILDKDWVKNIKKPFFDNSVDVVAGYYDSKSNNIFQKSLTPYVLVMKDKVREKSFLPATRSMAFKKDVWRMLKGFNEKLSHNEDYDFSSRIKRNGYKIVFAKSAVVHWIPRNNVFEAFRMFFRFSFGDIEANLVRDKVVYLFLRYIAGIYLVLLTIIMKSLILYVLDVSLFLIYISWAIFKNYKYVMDIKAFFYLPLLQFTSDLAIILGSLAGVVSKFSRQRLRLIVLNNKALITIILGYIFILLSTIDFGIPNTNHPFNYFMDEWHQSQSIRYLFSFGSPNLPGAANGPIFNYVLSGLYLIPFNALGIINVFAIKSSVSNLDLQFRLFEILRINTIIWGVLSATVFYYIVKKYFRISPVFATLLFVFNPLWINLSNFYKYDIALMFWILLSFLFMLKYARVPSMVNAVLIGFFSGLALSVKIEPLSLLAAFVILFVLFTPRFINNVKILLAGISISISTFLVFGIPDIILGKGDLHELLYSNLIQTPQVTSHVFNLGKGYLQYFLLNLYPVTFGRVLYISFAASLLLGLFLLIYNLIVKRKSLQSLLNDNRMILVLVLNLMIYLISLYPLKLGALSNRLIPLLIFIPIISVYLWSYIFMNLNHRLSKQVFLVVIFLLISFQIIETYSWVLLKKEPNPRVEASKWILANVSKGNTFGIENIPIYQFLPDIIEKEFYLKQYGKGQDNKYKYQVISYKNNKYPKYIIISNDYIESKFTYNSDKKILIKKLDDLKYRTVKTFYLRNNLYNVFNNRIDYFMSSLVQLPDTITIYEK